MHVYDISGDNDHVYKTFGTNTSYKADRID